MENNVDNNFDNNVESIIDTDIGNDINNTIDNNSGNKKDNKKKLKIAVGVVVAIALIAGIFYYNDLKQKREKFAAASELFENGNYAGASEGFKELGSFQDADDMDQVSRMFDEMRQEDYVEAAGIAEEVPEFTVKDEELQKAIDEEIANYYSRARQESSDTNYEKAAEIFRCLGDYEDSANAAVYNEALQKMKDDDLESAVTLFEKVKDYEDAAEHQKRCIDYLEAVSLQNQGDEESLTKAEEIFNSLGDFKESAQRALACKSVGLFAKAKALYDKKDYDGAYKILNQYPSNPYPGWTDLRTTCNNEINYKKAKKYYDDEHYYKAYIAFSGLGDFKDSRKLMKKCVKDFPDKKILYHNPKYDSSSVEFTIENNASRSTYIKLYAANNDLAARIFIKKNSSATISLTGGSYKINQAYGDTWYGTKDMFGESGYYSKCKVGGSRTFTLEKGYRYRMGSGTGGSAVSSETTGSGDF